MSLNIKIENFEGPFDLLLHLIKKNKMEIYDIKIYEITNQYLEYINTMDDMDLDITSEFIVIASTLIEIKSKMLLPKPKEDEIALDSDGMDPRQELVYKLIQYRKFKTAAEFFREKELGTGRMFSKKPEVIEERKKPDAKDFLKGVTMLNLFEVYNRVMSMYKNKINTSNVIAKEIPVDKFKIEDKMEYLKKNICEGKKILFSNIVEDCSSKMEIVVTFLALLELIKLRFVVVAQECNFKEIYLEGTREDEGYEY